jgi:hypothetical protein
MTKLKAISTILIDTRQALLDHGWCQKAYRNEKGNICLAQALSMAEPVSMELACSFLQPFAGNHISDFNDAPKRTFKQIVGVLDNAISAAMSEEAQR